MATVTNMRYVPKWKIPTSQTELLFHKILHLRELLVKSLAFLVLAENRGGQLKKLLCIFSSLPETHSSTAASSRTSSWTCSELSPSTMCRSRWYNSFGLFRWYMDVGQLRSFTIILYAYIVVIILYDYISSNCMNFLFTFWGSPQCGRQVFSPLYRQQQYWIPAPETSCTPTSWFHWKGWGRATWEQFTTYKCVEVIINIDCFNAWFLPGFHGQVLPTDMLVDVSIWEGEPD